MTPENRPDPDTALGAFRQAGKVLTDRMSTEHELRVATVGMLSAYAFMQGKPAHKIVEDIMTKKGEN